MKHISYLFVLLFLVSLSETNAQKYGLDNTAPSVFTNFKVPDTDLRSLWFNTNLNLSTNKTDNSSMNNGNMASGSSYYSYFNYNLSPHYFLLNESDNRYLAFNVDLYGAYSHNYSEIHPQYSDEVNTTKYNEYSTNLNLNFTYNNYINSGNSFYSAGSTVNVQMDDSKSEEVSGNTTNSYMGMKSQNYTLSIGTGIGKLRNVTPVVSAIRFQERLKQVNLLNTNLSDKVIEDLAQQFYKQSYYSTSYDRPDKYFWQDIDKVLSNDGVSLKDLNMFSDNYLRESVNEVRFLRNEGLVAGVNLQLNYQNNYQASTGYHYLSEQLFTLGQAYVIYSHQMNLNSQLNFNLSLSGGPNVLANPMEKQLYSLISALGYNYELTDRLVASISNTFNLTFGNYYNQYKLLQNNFNFSLAYFVEDNLSLNANYQWTYQINRNNHIINSDLYFRDINTINDHYINIGFTFYFERGFLANQPAEQPTPITIYAPVIHLQPVYQFD